MDRKARISKKATILLDRLERLSADSGWAHRASGLRGALMKILSQDGFLNSRISSHQLETIIQDGYTILNNAAREIKGQEKFMTEELLKKNDD